MPSFLDDEPTSDFLADPDDELNQFKVRPHPVGAGPQSTIREIIAQSQPKPAVSPEQQTGGSPMLGSGGGEQPMAAPDELRQGLDKFRTAQAHTQNVASWQPKPAEPQWWQRLAAGAIGGAAGYVNAAGRTHVDPTAAVQGALGVPGQQRKQAKWQSELARAKEGEAAAGQDLNAVEHMRQLESGEKTAESTRKHMDTQTAAIPGQAQIAALEHGAELIPDGPPTQHGRDGSSVDVGGKKMFFPSKGQQAKDKKEAEQVNWKPLPSAITSILGMDEGFKVPITEFDSYARMAESAKKDNTLHFVTSRDEITGDVTTRGFDTKTGTVKFAHTAKGEAKKRAQTAPGGSVDDPKIIAQGIMNGHQPPDTKGLYRNGTAVRAELERNGYDLMTAQRDWTAVQKHLSTLNGTQQERLRQAVSFTYDSLDQIEQLYDEWKREGAVSGVKLFNRASLAVSKNLPGKAGQAATLLEAQINDLTSELGTVYKGGNGSTDESLRLAGENLKGEWNEGTFKRGLDQIRKNLQIRRNSINNSQAAGVSADSPYAPKQTGTTAPPPPQKPIVQHSPSTGQYRYSLDGGKTWLPGQPPK